MNVRMAALAIVVALIAAGCSATAEVDSSNVASATSAPASEPEAVDEPESERAEPEVVDEPEPEPAEPESEVVDEPAPEPDEPESEVAGEPEPEPERVASEVADEPELVTGAVTDGERDAVLLIFDDIIARFPNASSSGDLAWGGPCPFGEQYGVLLIERTQVLCIIEDDLTIYGISPIAITVALEEDFALGGFEVLTDASGEVEWLEGTLDDDRFVFVERFVAGLSLISAQIVPGGADSESIAIALHSELRESAEDRVRALAMFDLEQILATADEIRE